MVITNKHNLPQAFVDLVKADEKEHNDKKYGVTTILKPVREIILKRRHDSELEIDVSDCVNRLFGSAFHSLIEKHDKTNMSEIDFEWNVLDDFYLCGRLDLYDCVEQAVIDYKTATVWKVTFKDFEDWRKQGLMYAWLCMNHGFTVKTIKFHAFLKDWTPREKRRNGDNYPDSQIYTYEYNIKISDLMEIDDYIKDKFKAIRDSLSLSDDDLAPCTPEDCWYTGDKWAVYKNEKNKTALRVFDTQEEACGYITNKLDGVGKLEYRQGEYRKCQDYCEVCKFCKYYKERGGK